MTVYEERADQVMRRRHPQQWARTRGTIEQRLQAMVDARNEDGKPCWSLEDWRVMYYWLRRVEEGLSNES